MDITTQVSGFSSYERTEKFIQTQISKFSSKYPFISQASVFVNKDDKNPVVTTEVRLQLKGKDVFASSMNKTLEPALKDCFSKLRKQVSKYKDIRFNKR